jgi:Heparinase II/III-like protein.
MRICTLLLASFAFLPVFLIKARAQAPSLFLTLQDFQRRSEIAKTEPWAKASLQELVREADAFPASYEERFGLTSIELPPEGGQWLHWYVCPSTGTPLSFRPPNHNVCPDTGKEYAGYPFDQVVYQMRNDALGRAALTLALAYRFTNRKRYAMEAAGLLSAYADRYQSWPLHDNHGKPTANGGKAYSQTLDESIWLIKVAWAYDLVRGAGVLNARAKDHIENDLLRASYRTVSKAHKAPTDNIQSWINAAIAAVGFTLNDSSLIHEALDGPIGFRYQMHHFVTQGFWIEGTFGYQFYAMRALATTAQMAKRHGIDLWRQEPALLSLFNGPMGVALPNGYLPAFNDSKEVNLYEQDYLYEQAYAAFRSPRYLPILLKDGRTSREALLFGVARIPKAPRLKLKSEVFAQAGFAALRNNRNDLTVITKFGAHGGPHGHYDKLSFVLYSQGRVMGVDPGTQLYGLPLHHEWDSMTIAHNTVSVDEQRQAAAAGKLISWKATPNWTAITMDAGPIYGGVSFQRSIVLTPNYCLVTDHIHSATPHTVDWIYHGAGTLDITKPTFTKRVTDLPQKNGYGLLSNVWSSVGGGELKAVFVNPSTIPMGEESNSNSPAATIRGSNHSEVEAASDHPAPAVMELTAPPDPNEELMHGQAPGPDLKIPVPFVLIRKHGDDATFSAILSPHTHVVVQQDGQHAPLQLTGKGFSDSISIEPVLTVKQGVPSPH